MKIQTRIKQRKIKGRWNYEGVASAVLGGRCLYTLYTGIARTEPQTAREDAEKTPLEAMRKSSFLDSLARWAT